MRRLVLAAALSLAAAAAAAEPANKTEAAVPPASRLSIDSTFADLIADPRTAAVLKKRMPGFVERMQSDQELAAMFGGITVREMSYDEHHARGFTPEVLARLDAELAAAQGPPAKP
jgi:hypothetical protein